MLIFLYYFYGDCSRHENCLCTLPGNKLTEYFLSKILARNFSIHYAQQFEIYIFSHFSII